MTALSKNNQNELLVSRDLLEADQTYELSFAPEGPNIPDFIQEFSTTLALCKCCLILANLSFLHIKSLLYVLFEIKLTSPFLYFSTRRSPQIFHCFCQSKNINHIFWSTKSFLGSGQGFSQRKTR